MTVNKGLEKLKAVLSLIESGEYKVINGKLFNKAGKLIKGSLGTEDGQVWYNVKGASIQGQKLLYVYYNGLQAFEEGKIVKHLDNNKLNNTAGNLIAVNKKGWVQELAKARVGLATEWVCYLPQTTTAITEDEVNYTEKELQARAIMQALNVGKTIKEVAEQFGVKLQRIYDIKNGKSCKKATEDLRQAL